MFLFIFMINLIGFMNYANLKNKEIIGKKRKAVHFFCPIGSLIGNLLFDSNRESFDWIIYGVIFTTFITILSLMLLKVA